MPHRMAYRKIGHAVRSNARRISMEKRGQAQNQAMVHASMRLLTGVGNIDASIMDEGMVQRMSLQGMPLSKMLIMAGGLGLADSMGNRRIYV